MTNVDYIVMWRRVSRSSIACSTHKICISNLKNEKQKYSLWIKNKTISGKTVFDLVDTGPMIYLKQIVINQRKKQHDRRSGDK